MKHRHLGWFVALVLSVSPHGALGLSDPNDFCTGDPCIITGTKTADHGVTVDFGNRAVILQGDLKLATLPSGNIGSVILKAGSFTIASTGQIEGAGGTNSGGSVSIQTTGNIALDSTRSTGAVRIPGYDGGTLVLVTETGDVTGGGTLNLDHDGTEASGGTLSIDVGGSVNLTGRTIMDGGTQGFGGVVDVFAVGDVSLGEIDMSAGEGGGGELTVVANGNVTFGDDVDMDGGADSGDAGFADVTAGGDLTINGRFRGRGAANGERCGDGADLDLASDGDTILNGEVDIRGLALDCAGGSLAILANNVHLDNLTRLDGDGSEGEGGSIDLDVLESISLTGTLEVTGGLGGGGEVSFFSEGDIDIPGVIDAQGRTLGSDGALLIDIDADYALTITGSVLGSGGSTGAGGDILFYGCDLTVGPLAVVAADGSFGSLDMTGTDSVSLSGQFLLDPATGNVAITYGTRADPPDIGSATFSVTPGLFLDSGLMPCRFCDTNEECADGNFCTDDVCIPATGCTNPPNTLPCNDGDACTTADACSGGACTGGPALDCDDVNECTDDTCNSATGCAHAPIVGPCDDGDACTENDACSGTLCLGDPLDCSDGNDCTDDQCNAGVCLNPPNGDPCDDADACTTNDICAGGSCTGGTALVCDDGDVCTVDSCNPAVGCETATIPGCFDTDGDGKLDNEDECTTLAWTAPPLTPPDQNPLKLRMNLKGLSLPPGGQSLILKGFFNPATTTPAIDPATNGLHVHIEDAAGVIYDVNVPGGLVGSSPCGERDGWKVGGAPGKTTWKYRNKSGALPPGCAAGSARGLSSLFVKDQSNTSKAALLMKIKAKGATLVGLPVTPATRLQATVALAAQPAPGAASAQAIAGQCAEALFTGNPIADRSPKPFCKVKQRGPAVEKISCKGP